MFIEHIYVLKLQLLNIVAKYDTASSCMIETLGFEMGVITHMKTYMWCYMEMSHFRL